MAWKLELTRLGNALYEAPDWLHPLPSWLVSVLPYRWVVKSFERKDDAQ